MFFSIQRTEFPDAVWKGDRLLLYTERGDCFFLHKAESVPLLYVEEAYSFSAQGSRCLLCTSESVPLLYTAKGKTDMHRQRGVPHGAILLS